MRRKIGPQIKHPTCSWADVWRAAHACEKRFAVTVEVRVELWPVNSDGGLLFLTCWARDTLWPNERAVLAHITREHKVRGTRSLCGDALILITDLWRELEGLGTNGDDLAVDRPNALGEPVGGVRL